MARMYPERMPTSPWLQVGDAFQQAAGIVGTLDTKLQEQEHKRNLLQEMVEKRTQAKLKQYAEEREAMRKQQFRDYVKDNPDADRGAVARYGLETGVLGADDYMQYTKPQEQKTWGPKTREEAEAWELWKNQNKPPKGPSDADRARQEKKSKANQMLETAWRNIDRQGWGTEPKPGDFADDPEFQRARAAWKTKMADLQRTLNQYQVDAGERPTSNPFSKDGREGSPSWRTYAQQAYPGKYGPVPSAAPPPRSGARPAAADPTAALEEWLRANPNHPKAQKVLMERARRNGGARGF